MGPSPRPMAPRFACQAFPPERFLLPGVRIFDPQHGVDLDGDLLVEGGSIVAIGPRLKQPAGVETLEDLAGCWVFPGFVDPHAHLRCPGQEYKEDLASGSLAAAAGGYVAVVGMANTDPVVDSGAVAGWVLDQAAQEAVVYVGQMGAVSKGLKGEELAELHDLAGAGVAAYSDDGKPISEPDLLLQALRYARGAARPLFLHVEDKSLSLDGVMHEGKWSARLGLRGIPSVAESGPLARDLEIVRYVHEEEKRLELKAQVRGAEPLAHFQHLSALESVRLVRGARAEGLPVTAEAAPHHLLLTDERLAGFDQNLKVNPPLRSSEDRDALVAALADGTIDCIGTDHAPHAPQEKEVPFEDALYGTTGLETAFAALHTGLVLTGRLPLGRLVEAMSGAPCRVLGVPEPRLVAGAPAHFCVADLGETWKVTPTALRGKSRNCAFLGETLTGRVRLTVVDGARRFARAQGAA